MSTAPGLRRFVRPAAPAARPGPAGDPQTGGGQASPAPGLAPPADVGYEEPTSAQSAIAAMPPLVAELLDAAPAPAGLAAPAPAGLAGPAMGRARSADTETCEMCAAPVPAEHGHVADLESSSLVCACRACYLLFTQSSAGRGRYKAVPDRYLSDPGRPLFAPRWDELEIPVGLAFFLTSSQAGRVAGFYPSPAGVTECVLDLGAWQRLSEDYPLLAAVAPDVEAALISRTADGVEYFVVPVDVCYELAGRMRLQWRGFDGGSEARASITDFLDRVRERARPLDA